jgi:DNA-binding LytR/AlgR family response regulator
MGNGELNGLDLSRIIRGQYPLSKIVFVTSHIEKNMEILKSGIESFGFIEKDFNRELMIREFENVLRLAVKTELIVLSLYIFYIFITNITYFLT